MTTVLPTLEYARPMALESVDARSAFRQMLLLSILSGLCVASCFLAFTDTIIAAFVQAIVFTVTISLAFSSSRALYRVVPASADPSRTRRMALDLIALVGLVGIGAAPGIYEARIALNLGNESLFTGLLGIAYLALSLTAWRHVMLYRVLAAVCRSINRDRMGRGLMLLGGFKAVYECLWLGCCAMALLLTSAKDFNVLSQIGDTTVFFAVGAMFGVAGFAIVWIWMIIVHAQLMRIAK